METQREAKIQLRKQGELGFSDQGRPLAAL